MPVPVPLLAVAAFVCLASIARANDTNYQTYVIGQRAMGMGGAATALADEAGGEYYNPAGLAVSSGISMSISQTVYSVQLRTLEDAVGAPDEEDDRADLSDVNVPIIPTALSFSFKFGDGPVEGTRRFALGYSMFVPDLVGFDFSEELEYDPPTANGITQSRLDIKDDDRTMMHGPTFAMRLSERWAVGLSLFHVHRTVSTWTSGYLVGQTVDANYVDKGTQLDTRVDRDVHSLLFKIGTRHDIDKNWRVGLALTMPSITLTGSGTLDYVNMGGALENGCPPRCLRFNTLGGDTDADSKTPFSIRMGGAYTTDKRKLTLALDLSIHTPITYDPYEVDNLDDFSPDISRGILPVGVAVVGPIQRNTVVNVNVGVEYLWTHWLIRGGFYTNFSSAPTIERTQYAQPADVDMYGISLSGGYRLGGAMIALGVIYAFGSGQNSVLSLPPPGTDPSLMFGPEGEQRHYFFFFIEGAGVAAQESVDTVRTFLGDETQHEGAPADDKKDDDRTDANGKKDDAKTDADGKKDDDKTDADGKKDDDKTDTPADNKKDKPKDEKKNTPAGKEEDPKKVTPADGNKIN